MVKGKHAILDGTSLGDKPQPHLPGKGVEKWMCSSTWFSVELGHAMPSPLEMSARTWEVRSDIRGSRDAREAFPRYLSDLAALASLNANGPCGISGSDGWPAASLPECVSCST